jgi:hypothetical protein
MLKKEDWDIIRRDVYKQAKYKCQCCGKSLCRLAAHEVWSYDDDRKIQKLKDIIAVCQTCHDVIHFGRSQFVYAKTPKKLQFLIDHWAKVNNRKVGDWIPYYRKITDIYYIRSKINFTVEIGKGWKLKE